MPRYTITDKFLAHLKRPESGARVYFADLPGFGVRISQGGTITFIYNYRNRHGEDRRIKIGRYPAWTPTQARNKALQFQNDVDNGRDPQAEKEAAASERALSFTAVSGLYMEDGEVLKQAKNTFRNNRQMLDSIILPNLGSRRIDSIERRDITKLHSSLSGTPYRANRVLALLSTIFNFAIEQKLRSENPTEGVKKYHEEKRERWLTADELAAFAKALDGYADQNAANCIRLLMLTGSRESEAMQATWSEFDLARGIWTKPSHHTKQKKTEHVALSDEAQKLLNAMHKHKKGPFLFPTESKDLKDKARVTIRRPWVQICKAAGLVKVEVRRGKRRKEVRRFKPTVRVHDLRHNFASWLVSSGVSLPIVGKLLGHTQASTTQRYAHLADSPLRDAANKFPILK